MTTFSVDTHLFRELGELLVGRDSTALIELLKNAYDADATSVVVYGESLSHIGQGYITITDNGIGMSRPEFEKGFLTIASRTKDDHSRRSKVFERRYTGQKGVGRLAAHKLARVDVPASCVVQTPQLLANAMIKALGKIEGDKWLEPCVGNGALLRALSDFGVSKRKIFGLDVDALPQPNDRFGKILRGTEFLRWSLSTTLRFDKVVANPPYVAIERLHPSIRKAAIEASLSEQIKTTANGNAWYAFLCAAIRLLNKDGSLCFLLPAAWDYANYAAPLRNSILQYFSAVEVYRTATPIFRAERVQEGAIVLLAKGRRGSAPDSSFNCVQQTSRREVSSIDDLILALSTSSAEFPRKAKPNNSIAAPTIWQSKERQSLGDLLNIRLGIVTGNSSYFLLSEGRRRELRLPAAAVRPVLSRARHLISPRMTVAQWNSLKETDERVWLFSPDTHVIGNRFVKSYLRYGRYGGCKIENHKVSIRSPWFRLPHVKESDAFMSGMSALMPSLSFRAMPKLTATNTLYVVNFTDPLLAQRQRLGIAISLLSSDVREQLRERGRPYAAGLFKHEPCDLLGLQVPAVGTVVAEWSIYRRALQALRQGDEVECRKIADGCFL
jgi:methylase of polypeptide subunit release factors